MRILLSLFGVALCAALAFWWWFSTDPTTTLIDAAGGELTAGAPPETEVESSEPTPLEEARALLEARQPLEAKELLVRLLEETDHDGETCILLSEVTLELEEYDEAVDYGLKATELLPDSAPAHLAYAKGLGGQIASEMKSIAGFFGMIKQLRLVKQEIERVIELDDDDTEARSMLAMYYMAPKPIGDTAKAIEVSLEIVERDPVAGNQLLAISYHQNGELERAIELCRTCLEEYPEERSFHTTLAGLFQREKRYEEADAEYEAARSGEKDETYYRSLYSQARMWMDQEIELERAIQMLDEFITADPVGDMMASAAHAAWRKGNAYEKLGQLDDARAAYEESLRLKPGFARAEEALQELNASR